LTASGHSVLTLAPFMALTGLASVDPGGHIRSDSHFSLRFERQALSAQTSELVLSVQKQGFEHRQRWPGRLNLGGWIEQVEQCRDLASVN
jgi:hypothetical protein